MPIRFKTEVICEMPPGASVSECSELQVPIIDWDVSPSPVAVYWQMGELVPADTSTVITYPELHALDEYADHTDFRYTHELADFEFIQVLTSHNPQNVQFGYDRKAYFTLRWRNFQLLPIGLTQLNVFVRAYARINGEEVMLEERVQTIRIFNTTASEVQPYPALDREVYEIVYNTTEDTFIGHTLISVTGALSPVTFTPLWAGNAGFEITPTAHHLQTSIQRTEHIASILTTPGVYDYEFSVSRNGIIYSIATIRVQVVGYMHLLRTNISSRENFCLDKNYIRLTKSASDVDRVRMTLYMQFQRRNEQPTLITQDYEYVFMQDELIIYPGQEIHDFFEDIRVDDAIPELANQGPGGHTVNHMSLRFLYSLCSVSIILQEYNSGYGAHARHEIKETHWIAGKRPVAYPYLTSSRLRRSYDASLISLCAVSHRFSAGNLHHIAAGTVDAAVVSEPNRIVQLMFRRNQSSYAPLSILSHLNLKIEPGVNVLNPIDVIFQNQNHVADWFTFAKPHTRETEMEFVLTHNLVRNVRAKANTEETRKITLNTGWFFAEELVVLEELIKSPIAYIRIQRDWYQAIPISKRPLHYDSERNLHQQLVEFQIVEND